MALPPFAVTDDTELETAVRDKTSYDDTNDEWPSTQASGNIEDAKRNLYMKTSSKDWYNDVAYGQALVAMTALKAKEAVENINIESYGIGDEDLSFRNADPDDSQQIRAWSRELNNALKNSGVSFQNNAPEFKNTASYIG